MSNDEGVLRSLPGRRSYAVATEPRAHAPPAPSCSSAISLPPLPRSIHLLRSTFSRFLCLL
eukprot:1831583-Pleurochrysis_carterae.AAC.2